VCRASASLSLDEYSASGMTPGLSRITMSWLNLNFCIPFVKPACEPTGAEFLPISKFITEDFPVFGYPITPTVILLYFVSKGLSIFFEMAFILSLKFFIPALFSQETGMFGWRILKFFIARSFSSVSKSDLFRT